MKLVLILILSFILSCFVGEKKNEYSINEVVGCYVSVVHLNLKDKAKVKLGLIEFSPDSLFLHADSTFRYVRCNIVQYGYWKTKKDSLYLNSDSSYMKNDSSIRADLHFYQVSLFKNDSIYTKDKYKTIEGELVELVSILKRVKC